MRLDVFVDEETPRDPGKTCSRKWPETNGLGCRTLRRGENKRESGCLSKSAGN